VTKGMTRKDEFNYYNF